MDREIEFWSVDEADVPLQFESKDDCIEDFLDNTLPEEEPDTIKIYGFSKKIINKDWILDHPNILDNFLDFLDEHFGWEEGIPTPSTENMKKAEKDFILKVLEEYEVTLYEIVCNDIIDLKSWKKENNYE